MRTTKMFLMAIAATLALAAPGSASAALTLGSTFNPTEECTPAGTTYVQTASFASSYVAPTNGVITSWAHQAGAEPPEIRFRVLRQRAGTSFFALVGESDATPQMASSLNEFPVRIPVQSGDAIGLLIGSSAAPYHCASPVAEDAEVWFHTPNAVGSEEMLFVGPSHGYRFDISAQLELDADRDEFGDETQDQCPNDASTQGQCPTGTPGVPPPGTPADTDPPQTKLTKRPPNKTENSVVQFKFRSDEGGSTFECKLDKKRFKPCSSPKKVKRLAQGEHTFEIRAKDAAGNVDPSPAIDRFTVVD